MIERIHKLNIGFHLILHELLPQMHRQFLNHFKILVLLVGNQPGNYGDMLSIDLVVCVGEGVPWQYWAAAFSILLKADCWVKLNLPLMLGLLSINYMQALSCSCTRD